MRKKTDIYLLDLLDSVMTTHGESVFGGVAGRDAKGNLLLPQILMRRAGAEVDRTLDHAQQDKNVDYNVYIIAESYEQVGDIEDTLLETLTSSPKVKEVSGGFDSGEVLEEFNERTFFVRVERVRGE